MAITLSTLPTDYSNKLVTATQTGSALAKVFNATPQRFGNQAFHTLTEPPKAQLLGAGEAKKATEPVLRTVTVPPIKAQVTMRFDEEVKWYDDERMVGIFDALASQGSIALSRSLDLAAIHGISPLEGTRYTPIQNPAVNSTLTVEVAAATPGDAIGAAYGSMLNANGGKGYTPAAMVLDPRFTYAVSQQRTQSGVQAFPEFGTFGSSVDTARGLRAAVSNTVSGVAELPADSTLRGLVISEGNFVWGIQKDLGLRMFEYGDPDNTGIDLAGHNQIALRLEMVFSFAWLDLNGVVKIVDAAA